MSTYPHQSAEFRFDVSSSLKNSSRKTLRLYVKKKSKKRKLALIFNENLALATVQTVLRERHDKLVSIATDENDLFPVTSLYICMYVL